MTASASATTGKGETEVVAATGERKLHQIWQARRPGPMVLKPWD